MAKPVTLVFYINDERIEVPTYENESIQITKKVTSIEKATTQSLKTNEPFKVPYTEPLIKAIGDLTDLSQRAKVDIRKSIRGEIIVDGLPVFSGSYTILSANKIPNGAKEMSLIFKGNETDLQAELSSIQMADFFKGDVIPWDDNTIEQFLDDPNNFINTNDYCYPLCHYGNLQLDNFLAGTATTLSKTSFKPAITFRRVINRIESELGFNIVFPASVNDLLTQVIPLHNNTLPIPNTEISDAEYSGEMSKNVSQGFAFTIPANGGGGTSITKLQFQVESVFNLDAFDLPNDQYIAPYTGDYSIKCTIDFSYSTDILIAIGGVVTANIYVNGTAFQGNVLAIVENINSTPSSGVLTFQKNVRATVNDTIDVRAKIDINNSFGYPGSLCTETFNIGTVFEVIQTPASESGQLVDVGNNLPDSFTVWDVVRTLITQCNGIYNVDIEGNFNVFPWESWIDDNSENIDLNENGIELDKDFIIEPTSVKGPKSIRFTYEDDEDAYNKQYKELIGETYGTLLIEDTGTDFGNSELTVKVPFAATPLVSLGDIQLVVPYFLNKEGKLIKTKPRNLYWNNITIPINYGFINGLSVNSKTSLPYFGHWEDLNGGYNLNDTNFGKSLTFHASSGYPNNNLYNRFWRRYIRETYGLNARQVTLSAKVRNSVVNKLEFNERILFRNVLLRVIEVSGSEMSGESLARLKMMYRVVEENIDIAPLYPYDIVDTVVQWRNSDDNTINPTPLASEVEDSCNAYGYFYDDTNQVCIQQGTKLEL